MQKKRWNYAQKGQISVFFILGILLVLLFLIFYFSTKILNPDTSLFHRRNLELQFDEESLKNYVEYCILNESTLLLNQLGRNGGTLNDTDVSLHSRTYMGEEYRELCINVDGAKYCVNRILTLEDMELELERVLIENLDSCIDFDYFVKRGYSIDTYNKSLDVVIGDSQINFALYYTINMAKEDYEINVNEFFTTKEHNLGLVHKLVMDILNHETTDGYFDKDEWMNDNNMLFEIQKAKPYPYVIYEIKDDTGFEFDFALELEDKVSYIGRNFVQDLVYGCCHVGQQCFKNVDEYNCKLRRGSYEHSNQCTCSDYFVGSVTASDVPMLDSCLGRNDGESWCNDEQGIGSRGIKRSCHNGITFEEPCKDFNEEVCVEFIDDGLSKAICKENRWKDCTSCMTQDCCENDFLRDCQWMGEDSYYVTFSNDNRKCLPKVSPGFRYWEGNGQEVCNIGTDYQECFGYTCGDEWVQHASSYCSKLGDCGINDNYKGTLSTSGFFETDPKYSPNLLFFENLFLTTNRNQEELAFVHEQETIDLLPALISAGLNYLDDLSHGRIKVLDYAFCGLWQAPLNNQECDTCNNDNYCSEYRCSSLGQDCVYSEEDGYPICKRMSGGGAVDIDIDLITNYSFHESTINIAGNNLRGFEIDETLYAHEILDFEIETSSPSKCKITYLPDLKFTETPAIWFGEPVFSTMHNVSFRLPEDISIPEKLYENLNITTLSELFNMIVENNDTLSNYFDDEFVEILDKLHLFLESKDYVIGVLNLSISEIEDNVYYTFVRCSDQSGNEMADPVYLKFTINGSYEDLLLPNLLYSIPTNNSELSNDTYELRIYLDEPAECRYSDTDQGYSLMPYEFDCETSRMRLSSVAGGSYECKTTTNIFNPYIRCMDNPPEVRDYVFSITNDLRNESVNYMTNGTSIILTEGNLFNNTIVNMSIPNWIHNITFLLPDYYSCKYGFNGYNYDLMVDLNCIDLNQSSPYNQYGSIACTQDFVPADYSVYLTCITEQPQIRNINDKSFFLSYTYNTDLAVVSYFPDYDQVLDPSNIALGVVVNRNIYDNNVNCGYSLGNGEVYQMNTYGTYQFKRSLYGLDSGDYHVTFSCTDSSGFIAEAYTKFSIT